MTHPLHKRPLILGLLPAPAAAVVGVYLGTGEPPLFLLHIEWQVALLLYGIALVGIVVLFMPAVLLLRSRAWLSWSTILLAAVLSGNLYYQLLGLVLSDGFYLGQLIEGTLAGLFAGLSLCIGVGPNYSFKPTSLRYAA